MIRVELRAAWRSWKADPKISRIEIKAISDVQMLFFIHLEMLVEVETSSVDFQKLFNIDPWTTIVFFDILKSF
jgi:hypothetical protein